MGFINPGKSLKKRKLRQSTALVTSESISEVEYKHKPTSPHLKFDDLPYYIIRKIFIYAGPGNNIPLINKSLHQLLKFDKHYTGEGPWYNISLVLELVTKFYLYDLNVRLDFDVIEKKLDYYTRIINQYKGICPQNVNYKRLVRNHAILDEICTDFSRYSLVLLDKALNNKFISNRVLELFTTKYLIDDDEDMEQICKFKTMAEILFIQKLRLRAIRLKFAELSMEATQLFNNSNNLTIDYTGKSMEEIIKSVEDWDRSSRKQEDTLENPRLCSFDDERLPVKEIPYQFSFRISEDRYLFSLVDPPRLFRIPPAIIGSGISSVDVFEIVQRLERLQPGCLGPVEPVVSKTLKCFQLENITNFPFQKLPLEWILAHILSQAQATATSFNEVILEMFRLFDSYTKIDYSIYGDNINGENIVQDLSRTCFLLLFFYFQTFTNVEFRPFWTEAIKLRNIQLTQILRKLDPNPEYDILHNFS
ncbi:hypothetical protein JA1_001850 [Spathaspora sp. JA1]|nr:hypothetical protein JA1_001850 [Spathaspora sp. JA1]